MQFQFRDVQKSFVLKINEEPGDNQGGGAATFTEAELQRRVSEAVEASVTGLKNKNQELLGAMASYKEQLKQFEGVDVEGFKSWKEKVDQDEDVKLFTSGQKHLVIEKHTQRMRDEHKAQLEQYEAKVREEAQRADTYKGAVLDNQIRSVTAGMHPSAVEDALLLGRTIFQLDAKGNAVKLDSEGRPELGKDGSSPFSPKEWIETMKEAKPHWFPAMNSGSGSSNAREGGGSGKTMSRSKFDSLTQFQQIETVRGGIKIVD